MKRTKRIFAIFMTLALAMSMLIVSSAVSFAAEGDKTITLTGGKAGHTYTLYQIFTGTVDGNQLTSIQWGNGVTDTFKSSKGTAAAYAKEVKEAGDARKTAQDLIAASALTNGTPKALSADGNVVFDKLAEGYYVIVDTNGNTTPVEGDYSSALIVQVVKDVNIGLKGSKPTSEKKVKDVNDSEASSDTNPTGWQDSADYDIGDMVPFQLKATTADNVAAYTKYHITFQDKQSAGLDAPTSFTITIPGTTEKITLAADATSPVTKEVTFGEGDKAVTVVAKAEKVAPDNGRTFAIKVSFENKEAGKLLPADLNTKDILVNYSSKLNSNAKLGSTGNPNEMFIYYSSNPENKDDNEEGKTPDDKVIVFTFNLKVDKTDEEGNALKGAGFTLYKKDSSGKYVAVGTEITGADITSFTWTGLDDGSYKIEETTVPAGYNKAEDITFDVVAVHDPNSQDPKLTELKVEHVTPTTATIAADKDATGSVDTYVAATEYVEGTTYYTKGEDDKYTEATGVTAENFASGKYYIKQTNLNANMSTTVINKSGAELPSTGGIGTIIFYVLGSLLVVGCGIVLISKRRMESR